MLRSGNARDSISAQCPDDGLIVSRLDSIPVSPIAIPHDNCQSKCKAANYGDYQRGSIGKEIPEFCGSSAPAHKEAAAFLRTTKAQRDEYKNTTNEKSLDQIAKCGRIRPILDYAVNHPFVHKRCSAPTRPICYTNTRKDKMAADVADGSFASFWTLWPDVGFVPDSDRFAPAIPGRRSAINRQSAARHSMRRLSEMFATFKTRPCSGHSWS